MQKIKVSWDMFCFVLFCCTTKTISIHFRAHQYFFLPYMNWNCDQACPNFPMTLTIQPCNHTHAFMFCCCHVVSVAWSKTWLKALCHFHHKRISIMTTNFPLFSTSAAFGRCIHFSEPAWIFQSWVTDPVKNEKREVVGGTGREV